MSTTGSEKHYGDTDVQVEETDEVIVPSLPALLLCGHVVDLPFDVTDGEEVWCSDCQVDQARAGVEFLELHDSDEDSLVRATVWEDARDAWKAEGSPTADEVLAEMEPQAGSVAEQRERDERIRIARRDVSRMVEQAREDQAQFTASVERDGLAYAIEWASSAVRNAHLGAFARRVEYVEQSDRVQAAADAATPAFLIALRAVTDEVRKALLTNSYPSSSSSALTNASNFEKAAAAAAFLDRAEGALRFIDS